MAYQQRLLDASSGKVEFPKTGTLGKTEAYTNNVFHDIHAATAEQMYDITLSA